MTYGLGRDTRSPRSLLIVPPLNRLRPAVHLQHSVISPDSASSFPGTRARLAARTGPFGDQRPTNALHVDHRACPARQLLKFGDGVGMGHSLEARMPFLDYRLVEFVFGIPWRTSTTA